MARDGLKLVRKTPDQEQEIDRRVGARIRERRVALGISQRDLAELIGINFQQLHKYETGVNRISAGWLFQFAEALNVNVGYFFEGLDVAPAEPDGHARMTLDLTRSFNEISNPRYREALAAVVLCMAEDNAGDGTASGATRPCSDAARPHPSRSWITQP